MCATDSLRATTLPYTIASTSCAEIALQHGCRADIIVDDLGTPLQLANTSYCREPDVIRVLESSLEKQAESGTLISVADQPSPSLSNDKSEKEMVG